MFGLYFGQYLVEKNKLTRPQFEELIELQSKTRVKLGLIAVSEKLLTTKQADDINDIQKSMDRRFGDIAIEKGYLLAEEVTYLLNSQGNPYLQFVQACTDNNILTLSEIEAYLEDFKRDNNLSSTALDALKTGDIDRIISIFVDKQDTLSYECIGLVIRNMVRFIDSNVILKPAYKAPVHSFGALASQRMIGDHEFFVGLSSETNELLQIANPFAKESFNTMDEDSFDSVCEFINCSNGLYASKLSHENIHIDMSPPLYYSNQKITAEGELQVVPIVINGDQVNLVVAVNQSLSVA
ncbi:MAG: chemotaxis protein CheX [Mobilitalea sp.]